MKKLKLIDEFYSLKAIILGDQKRDVPVIVIPAGTCGQASGANEGKLINPQAVLALYLLGLPYPGGSKDKDNSAIAALRFFGSAPAESQ